MRLDCMVYQSPLTPKQMEDYIAKCDLDDDHIALEELWYGRKTNTIMGILLEGYEGEDNCVYIPSSHIDISTDKLVKIATKEIIHSILFKDKEYEFEDFKELIHILKERRDPEQYLYFYAWY